MCLAHGSETCFAAIRQAIRMALLCHNNPKFNGKDQATMGDTGDDFRAFREVMKKRRAELGVPCPECRRLLPKANPSILLPGQRCKIHKYRDPRRAETGIPMT